jgi:hypothetical protein
MRTKEQINERLAQALIDDLSGMPPALTSQSVQLPVVLSQSEWGRSQYA